MLLLTNVLAGQLTNSYPKLSKPYLLTSTNLPQINWIKT